MLPLRCSSSTKASSQVYRSWKSTPRFIASGVPRGSNFAFKTTNSELFGKQVAGIKCSKVLQWSFLGGAILAIQPKVQRPISCRRPFSPAFWLLSSQIANYAFTLGTIAVLPFYSLMVLAPNTELTNRSMKSSIPFVMLGILYAYLLYLSWTPDTIRLMFASKYWLPELPGIAKMFSNEMTMASAWIHLLVVDLFAARQIFYDGLKNDIETRHSISLCLLFCPIGIVAHAFTKLWKKILQPKMKAANY